MGIIVCMVDGCDSIFDNPYASTPEGTSSSRVRQMTVPDTTAAIAAHWSWLSYPDGPRFICPGCQKPRPKPQVNESHEVDTPKLFD